MVKSSYICQLPHYLFTIKHNTLTTADGNVVQQIFSHKKRYWIKSLAAPGGTDTTGPKYLA